MQRKRALRVRIQNSQGDQGDQGDRQQVGVDPKTGRLLPGYRYVKGGGVVKV